jgi:alpha-mannosidase/mannosylglycerate hydrolase
LQIFPFSASFSTCVYNNPVLIFYQLKKTYIGNWKYTMPRKAHYVVSTHWDREWYQTFQDYRYRLVQLLDRVLEGWQREDLCGPFQTDGQAVILEDYLEVRPERAEQVSQLVREGRFVVGPWYVLPDEFLVSGESLIRNLRLGRETASRLGGRPSSAGFLCDMFGHNSQMPQILAGFGIRGGFLWRGINLVDQHLFIWRGADGTELPVYRFGKIAYCSYAVQVRGANPSEPRPTPDEIETRLQAFLEEENEKTIAGPLLLFDGGDHLEWDPNAYAVLSRHLNQPGEKYEILHSSLESYLDGLTAVRDQIPLVVEGELREPGLYPDAVDAQWLIPGVTSSRVRIKQANAACQSLLCQWAEPVSVFAGAALELPYPQGYLDVAWKWLIQNHPHDSICGCSIDAVHEDMLYRFNQCEQIANRLTVEATRRIAASVQGQVAEDELRVVVFNPLLRPFDGIADLDLDLPLNWPKQSGGMGMFEPKPGFRIYDAEGRELAPQRTGQAMNRARVRTFDWVFPQGYQVNVVRVSLPLQIPASGYTTLILRPASDPVHLWDSTGLATSERSMENEFLAVEIGPDGALAVTDKRSMQVYRRLLTFEDRADIGDGWNFGPAMNDQIMVSTGGRSSLALVINGPYRTTFRLRTVMDLPAEFDFNHQTRAEQLAGLVIDSLITLRAGADWVEVETTVHNNVKDHRLRVTFPSGARAETCLMDTPFDVVERTIALRADNDRYREVEVEFKPQQSFTAVFDDQRGLAIISSGLLECAVQDLPERPVALTLFRATRRTVMTDGEPGGQMLGDLHFNYWIVPLKGAPDRARLFDLGHLLAGGLRTAQLTRGDVARFRQEQVLPVQAGCLSLEGPAVVTSLRKAGQGTEVRLFNPNTFPVEATLDFSALPGESPRPAEIYPVDFESNPIGQPYPVEDGRVTIPLEPKQICTLRF